MSGGAYGGIVYKSGDELIHSLEDIRAMAFALAQYGPAGELAAKKTMEIHDHLLDVRTRLEQIELARNEMSTLWRTVDYVDCGDCNAAEAQKLVDTLFSKHLKELEDLGIN